MKSLPKNPDDLKSINVPSHLFLPKGMIVPEEIVLLYLLAHDLSLESTVVVDAGAFCGASAYAFAAGLDDSGRGSGKVYSYDLFEIDDSYTKQYIQNNFYYFTDLDGDRRFEKYQVKTGESFLDVFMFQTQRYRDLIEPHSGSILNFKSPSKEIGILFIDVAKTLEIQSHLFKHFLPCLVPSTGILIQQDFHHAYHPYIHVAMEYLSDYFELIYSKVGASRVYRLKNRIPQHVIDRVVNYDFTNDEIHDLMRLCISNSPSNERPLLNVLFARHLMLNNDSRLDSVIHDFVRVYSSHPGYDWLIREMTAAVGAPARLILNN